MPLQPPASAAGQAIEHGVHQALQLGTIDATEFSMPVMDLSLGFHQVAKFYYFPGWHQQATFGDLIINKAKWDSLSATQKATTPASSSANVRSKRQPRRVMTATIIATMTRSKIG